MHRVVTFLSISATACPDLTQERPTIGSPSSTHNNLCSKRVLCNENVIKFRLLLGGCMLLSILDLELVGRPGRLEYLVQGACMSEVEGQCIRCSASSFFQ
eukprot:scaffold6742_cov14-Tisochrysis_lutea.AAC.2